MVFGFRKRRLELATQVANFLIEDTFKNLMALSCVEVHLRKKVAEEVYTAYCQIANTNKKKNVLKSLIMISFEKRHVALRAGANNRSDPLWACAALIETIATLELLDLKGLDVSNAAVKLCSGMALFVNHHVLESAKRKIRFRFIE